MGLYSAACWDVIQESCKYLYNSRSQWFVRHLHYEKASELENEENVLLWTENVTNIGSIEMFQDVSFHGLSTCLWFILPKSALIGSSKCLQKPVCAFAAWEAEDGVLNGQKSYKCLTWIGMCCMHTKMRTVLLTVEAEEYY